MLAAVGCGNAPAVELPVPAASPASAEPAAVEVAAPARVRIPATGAESSLPAVPLIDGEIQIPPVDQPGQAVWWQDSPRPGELGPAVLLGHVDGVINGEKGHPGVFHGVGDLPPGAEILVDRADGSTARFEVYKVEQIPKDQHAQAADRIYGDTAGPELRLITCGGEFDRATGHYEDNEVVYARGV